MTRDDIIRMAREAGMPPVEITSDKPVLYPVPDAIERFAALVAAAENERLSLDSIHTCHAKCQRPLCRLTRERDVLRQIVEDFPPIEAELAEVSDRAHRLEAQRDALLEALRAAVADWDEEVSRGRWLDAARAAIKKAEEA